MTYVLETKSHGNIDAGFYSSFTALARVGEYTFLAKDLCGLAAQLATSPKLRNGKLLDLGEDSFWEGFQTRLMDRTTLPRNLQTPTLEEVFDLGNSGNPVSLHVHKSENSINIGRYRIAARNFSSFSYYLASGELFGWGYSVPGFSELTVNALRQSQRPLFRHIS